MNIGNSFNTQNLNYLQENKTSVQNALSKIVATRELSGKDSASLMIADSLNSQISSLSQGLQNSNDAIGMLQIADGALSNISKSTTTLQELSVRNNNAALNSNQKAMLQQEFTATVDGMRDIVSNTTYNGKSLFGDSLAFDTGSGVVQVASLDVNGLSELSIDNQDGIESFLQSVNATRSEVGSVMQQFSVSITNSLSSISNLTAASSQIEETPMDQKINDFNSSNIKLQSSILAQVHQNQQLQARVSTLLA